MPVPPQLPDIWFARDHSPGLVAARVRTGTWEPVGRGAYVATTLADRRGRALARIVATHDRTTAPHCFSHESAALVWGLPVWRTPALTHLRQDGRAGGERDRTVARHRPLAPPEHQAVVTGLPVTSLALTAVDCALRLAPLDALVVADAALRAGAEPAVIADLLERRHGHNGTTTARAVLAAADPGAESAPETATRYHLLATGLPAPTTQVPVETWCGTYWADLGYPEHRLLIEYDGRSKYTDPDELMREKRRHDAVTETGARLLRITRDDLCRPRRLVARVRALLPDLPRIPRPHLQG